VSLDTKTPLTVNELLATFGLSPAQGDVPEFLTKALSSVSLTSFRLGWSDKLGVRLPDYLEIMIRVENLPVVGSFIDVDDVSIRLRIDNIGRNEPRNVYLQSGGVVHLVGVEHLASFTYGQHPALTAGSGGNQGGAGPVDLAIHCTDTPLSLGAILGHFWPNTEILPEPFSEVIKEVGLSDFSLKMRYSESQKKQVVQTVKIGLAVTRSEIEILGMFCPGLFYCFKVVLSLRWLTSCVCRGTLTNRANG
jgi:hypothetical protein